MIQILVVLMYITYLKRSRKYESKRVRIDENVFSWHSENTNILYLYQIDQIGKTAVSRNFREHPEFNLIL